MKKIFLIFAVLLLAFALNTNAALVNNGDGTITVADTMWLQDAGMSGLLTWPDAMDWADTLIYAGYDDWRLPVSDTCTGTGCSASEMGYLYYVEGVTPSTPGVFQNLQNSMYWSETEDAGNSANAWRFSYKYGTQDISNKGFSRYALAVRDIAVVPEPIGAILFIAGGAFLAAKKKMIRV